MCPKIPEGFINPSSARADSTRGGTFRFRSEPHFLIAALYGERIGLKEVDDGLWGIYFAARFCHA